PSGASAASLLLVWLVMMTTTDRLDWSATFSNAFCKWRARSRSPLDAAAGVVAAWRAGPAAVRKRASPMVNQRAVCELECDASLFIKLYSSTHVIRACSNILLEWTAVPLPTPRRISPKFSQSASAQQRFSSARACVDNVGD